MVYLLLSHGFRECIHWCEMFDDHWCCEGVPLAQTRTIGWKSKTMGMKKYHHWYGAGNNGCMAAWYLLHRNVLRCTARCGSAFHPECEKRHKLKTISKACCYNPERSCKMYSKCVQFEARNEISECAFRECVRTRSDETTCSILDRPS